MQLNVGVKPDALQDIGGQVLVWVMTEPAFEAAEVEVSVWRGVGIARDAALRPTVPHSVTSPLRGFGLTNGNGLAATTVDVRWGDPRLPLVSGGREVAERVLESPLGLSPSLIGRDYVEDGEAGRRLGRGWPLLRRPGGAKGGGAVPAEG